MSQETIKTKIIINLLVVVYILCLSGAELIGAFGNTLVALIAHIILFLIFLNQYLLQRQAPYSLLLIGLALCSLLRILNFSISFAITPAIFSYALIGGFLLISILLFFRLHPIDTESQVSRRTSFFIQTLIILVSFPLSVIAYVLLMPGEALVSANWINLAAGILVLVVFNAAMEEVIFRWIIRRGCQKLFGLKGIIGSSFIFAIMGIGFLSPAYFLFLWAVGLLFDWSVHKTQTIIGVVIAHSVISINILIVLPLLNQ